MSNNSMSDITERIKARRLELEYSFQDLADLTKMSKSTLQRYETGSIKNIPLDKLKVLADALRTTPEQIMGWEKGGEYKTTLSKEAENLLLEFGSCNDGSIKEHVIGILRDLNQIFNENREIDSQTTFTSNDAYRREYNAIEILNYSKVVHSCASQIGQKAAKIADHINQNAAQNLLEIHNEKKEHQHGSVIKLRLSEQSASAGTGTYLGPENFVTISVLRNTLTEAACFGIPVSGNSMEPRYSNGDILLVANKTVAVGEIGVFTLDGSGYVKELGGSELISLNQTYDPIPMNESIRCNGKVIGILDSEWIVED